MAEERRAQAFSRLLAAAGRAHHEIFGGPNPGWPEWYAKYLVERGIQNHVGFQPNIDQVANWLRHADEIHRAEAPDQPWPPVYADVILRDTKDE